MSEKLLCTFALCLALPLLAMELPVDGTFSKVHPDSTPAAWQLHPWKGFQPYAVIRVQPGAENTPNILTVTGVESEHGTCIRTAARFPGRSGDEVKVALRTRGSGTAGVQLYYFSAEGDWLQPSAARKFILQSDWQEHLFTFIISNGTAGETASFHVCLTGDKGMQADFTAVSARWNEGKYRGDLPTPTAWRIFAPVRKEFQPSPEELNRIPEMLDNRQGQPATLLANQLDTALFMGPGAEKCAWAFAELEALTAADWTLGAAADWWMTLYLNGEKIIDTSEHGNQKTPFSISNHIATARLKPGRNILAARIVTGMASSIFMFGGPQELRKLVSKIKISGIRWIEDFDSASVRCSGSPELIQGHPTPGLLSVTGQAVFRTGDTLSISPPETLFPYPGGEKQYLAGSIRIQNFGREESSRADSELDLVFAAEEGQFAVRISHRKDSEQLLLRVAADAAGPREFTVPCKILPADFILAAAPDGSYAVAVNSLADSSSRIFRGDAAFFKTRKRFTPGLVFRSTSGKTAELVADNFIIGTASDETKNSATPFRNRLDQTFDPVKANWPLVFSDDFDGSEVDLQKWYFSYSSRPDFVTVKDGLARIKADWNSDRSKLESASLYTNQDFLFGYFEAKVRFRKEHGWWAAFWLCTENPSNPFVDGFEIDIFEDYYLRSKVPGGPPGDILDHNLHIFAGGTLKSWNYHSKLPGSIDDFHVIGCKWTPFEISYYMNGRLMASSANHSPYDSVTFDPFNHAAGLVPLKAILSGCVGRSGGDPKDGNFPEEFLVDQVRIYALPQENSPQIRLLSAPSQDFTARIGSILTFEAEVLPSQSSKAPVENVYLFDSGSLLDCKKEPPYRFEVMLTKEYFDTTDYVKPGRSGQRLEFAPTLHAFSVLAQDAAGEVAFSKPVLKMLKPAAKSIPYQGKPLSLPGTLPLSHYDEGGQNVAYFDTTAENTSDKSRTFRPGEGVDAGETGIGSIFPWEWLNYTVRVEKSGTYTARLGYGTPLLHRKGFLLLVNDSPAGEFEVITHAQNLGFGITSCSEIKGIKLEAGQNLLTLIAQSGGINIRSIEFQPE